MNRLLLLVVTAGLPFATFADTDASVTLQVHQVHVLTPQERVFLQNAQEEREARKIYVKPYIKEDGTYVGPTMRILPDSTERDN